MSKRQTPLERFRRKYRETRETGCWQWIGSTDGSDRKQQYGRFALDGHSMIGAHRASYLLHVGDIPDGMEVCHHCDNPPCVNPAHLFLGTRQDNVDDKLAKGREWHQLGKPSPRTGTGMGRNVPGKGCVVDTNCDVCGAPTLHRVNAFRLGRIATCSLKCRGALNSVRQKNRVTVACAECGKAVERKPSALKKNKRTFCSPRCTGLASARARWAS